MADEGQPPKRRRKRGEQPVTPDGRRIGPDGVPELGEDENAPTTKAELARQTATNAAAAVNLAIEGAPYDEIARLCGYTSAAQARFVVEEQLASMHEFKDRKSLFALTAARHEALLRSLAPNALKNEIPSLDPETGMPVYDRHGNEVMKPNKDQVPFAKLYLDVLARTARLHGLDAPTEVKINPSAAEFEKVLTMLDAAQREGEALEADIWADDEIEDAVEVGPEDEIL